MNELELIELRRTKWHLDGHPLRTREDARAFLESVGFCLMYPQRTGPLLPTLIGAYAGSDDRLPGWQQAFADPRAQDATELMVRLLRERDAYEANLFGENNPLLIAGSIFPYFYALTGERNPKQAPKAGPRSEYSELACDTFVAIQRGGPISKVKLQETLGGSISTPALDRALAELSAKLRITRVDYNAAEGSSWDVLYRWSADAVREGIEISLGTGLSACLSRYLDSLIAADEAELETFFGSVVSRSRIREALNALLAARELEFVRVGNRSLVQITPPKVPFVKPALVKTEFKKREFKPASFKRAEPRRPEFRKPEFNRPAFKKPEPEAVDFKQANTQKPDFKKPDSERSKINKTAFKKAGFKKPDFKKSGFKKRDFGKSDSRGSGFKKSGFRKDGPKRSFSRTSSPRPRRPKA
jgi:hypothetical protein